MVVVLLVGLVISQEMKVSEKAQGSEALIDTHLLDTCTSENGGTVLLPFRISRWL